MKLLVRFARLKFKSLFTTLCIVFLVTVSCEDEHDPLQLIYGTWQTTTWSRMGCDEQDQVGIPCGESNDEVECVTLVFSKDGQVETTNEDGTTDQAFYSITEEGFLITDSEESNLFSPWNFSQETMNLHATGNDGCVVKVSFQRI